MKMKLDKKEIADCQFLETKMVRNQKKIRKKAVKTTQSIQFKNKSRKYPKHYKLYRRNFKFKW